MKRVSIFIILIAAMCISNTLSGASFPASGDTLIVKETPKRAFFIIPFYQFTSFQDLRPLRTPTIICFGRDNPYISMLPGRSRSTMTISAALTIAALAAFPNPMTATYGIRVII